VRRRIATASDRLRIVTARARITRWSTASTASRLFSRGFARDGKQPARGIARSRVPHPRPRRLDANLSRGRGKSLRRGRRCGLSNTKDIVAALGLSEVSAVRTSSSHELRGLRLTMANWNAVVGATSIALALRPPPTLTKTASPSDRRPLLGRALSRSRRLSAVCRPSYHHGNPRTDQMRRRA